MDTNLINEFDHAIEVAQEKRKSFRDWLLVDDGERMLNIECAFHCDCGYYIIGAYEINEDGNEQECEDFAEELLKQTNAFKTY